MKTRRLSILIALFLCLPLSSVYAQKKGAAIYLKWWQNQKLVERLALESDELKALDEQHYQSKLLLIDFKAQIQKNRLALGSLLDEKDLDKNDAFSAFNRLEQSRKNLSTEMFRYLLEVRDIIGVNRFIQLKKILRYVAKEKRLARAERKARFKKQQAAP